MKHDEAVLEVARRFNKSGIVQGSGNALEEMKAFEKLIKQQERLLSSTKGEVPVSEAKRLKEELKELKRAQGNMHRAAEQQALRASAAVAEEPRLRGQGGIYEVDGAIMDIFKDAAECVHNGTGNTKLNNTASGMRRMHMQYEGGEPQSPRRTSVSKIEI